MLYLVLASVIICGYLLGNINFALIISKLYKRDIRKESTGNPGAMNMFRSYGKKLGVMTLVLDGIKGAVASIIGWFLIGSIFGVSALPAEAFGFGQNAISMGGFFEFSQNKLGMFIGGVGAIIGHIYPVFLKFKGGKGIATTIGVCFVISPIIAIISLASGIIFIILTKIGTITSFLIISPPLIYSAIVFATKGGLNAILIPLIVAIIFALTLFRHRSNIKRLIQGTENKTVLFKKKDKSNQINQENQENQTIESK